VLTDISESRGAEKGVDQSVGYCVSVRMSLEPGVVRHENTAKDEGPPRLKAM
jgi:hypothetical protein